MVADDCFGVLWLCRNDVSKDVLMCDGLDAIDFFFVSPTPHKILLVRPNRLTEYCCLSSIATLF
jgi:hypothetical protein